ncbi:MAG: PDZ domain-containing protein [Bacteroidales bacterium]|nr:PDZ domain-containing protein [Bacteroidales bacterium]
MRKIAIIAIALFVGLSATAQQPQINNEKAFEISKNLEIFADVYKNLHLNYVDDLESGKLMKTAIDAMLASLDPYTNYIPESDIEDVKLQIFGQYGGIGSMVSLRGDYVIISEPYEGLPAAKAGLKAGDKILEINGESAKGKSVSDVSSTLRGQAGTSLTMKIERQGKTHDIKITREEIKLKPVPYFGLVDGDFGYIKLNEFTQNSAADVTAAFNSLKSQNKNLKGVVLDLRGNGGGLLNEAVDIVNIFMNSGELVVQTKGKVAEKNTKHYTRKSPVDKNIPVAVLIDGYSASASEIVAGSLQDFDRAVIIGSRSYGKGLVQNIVELSYNSQMKVTVSKYFIPSGRCIQALDYSHRDENGRAVKVPDSLKTAFKTRNGRTVYDGFGIEPDVEVEPEYMSNISVALLQKNLVFDYVTDFYYKHKDIAPASQFRVTDDIYNDFKNYISTKEYEYSTNTEKTLKILREKAKEEKYLEAIEKELSDLEKKLQSDKLVDLDKNKEEVKQLIESEILTRYYYEKGRTEGMLKYDNVLHKAIKVLSNKEEYNKILKK